MRIGLVTALLLAGSISRPALAQDASDERIEEIFATARGTYGVTSPGRCSRAEDGEIVVCAGGGPDQRVPSTSQSDPNSREARRALDNGVPRAPQLDRGSCKGQAGCVVGGWAPPPVYYIDLKAIPEPAPGSDADKIAKGEMAAP